MTATAKMKLEKSKARTQDERDLSHQMLGAAKYAEYLHRQTGSDLIRFLLDVRDTKRFLDYDCDSYDDFLDSVHSPMSRTTFYRKFELYQKEGEQYDLFEEWKVPVRVRRQLMSGDVTIDESGVMIGDHRMAIGDNPTILKQAIEKLVREKIAAEKQSAKLIGIKAQYDRLKAEVDEFASEPEYVTAFKAHLQSLRVLIAEVKDLPGEMKGERGPLDLPEIYLLMEQLISEYGEPLPWVRGSWNFERPNWREQEKLPYFQSDAIDSENF